MLNHIVKRGVAHLQAVSPEYLAKLQEDAELYEKAAPDMEVSPSESLPVLITAVIFFLILASIRYTLGDVVASLAMIESPSTTTIVEQKLPAYADEEPLIPAEDVDVEITVINRKPITASLCGTLRHLRRAGGFFARWRGLGIHILYHLAYALISASFSSVFGIGRTLLGNTFSFLQRIVPRSQCKPLVLPTLVYAAAQQATFLAPLAVAYLLGVTNMSENTLRADRATLALTALRILAVPLTAALLALFVLLPAAATLTRIEAALLPADAQPLVPFDRAALVGDLDLSARGAARALFAAAWRSFDRSARTRVLKVYAKMLGAQVVVSLLGLGIMATEVYVIGGERLAVFYTSARAQLELMAIEAQQNKN
ncbi:hypothetical protein B0H11DRAFT_2070033 [Mycena galericulata]|nr:hypothetical protein B0H11DRAFT_2070033 [Mycena galericulata]